MAIDRKEKRYKISEWFIFSWIPEKNAARTLAAFLIFSTVIHFLGFYLFIVEYPTNKSDVRTDSLTILDPNDMGVQTFLRRISDRIVYLEPPSESSTSRIKLSDYAIRFAPSFAEVKPDLKRLSPADKIGYFSPPEPLPQIPGKAWQNPVKLSPNLENRGVAPYSILDDYLNLFADLPDLRVNLEIDPSGKPIVVLVPGEASAEDKKLLSEAIRSTLRFTPVSESEGVDHGWIEFKSEG